MESDMEVLKRLLPERKQKVIKLPVSGVEVTIQSIKFGELMTIYKQAKDDPMEYGKWLIYKCLVNPKLTPEQVMELSPRDATELITSIMDLSGYSMETINFSRGLPSMTTPLGSGT